MFDNKFIVTLMALIIGVIAISNFNKKNDITEGFIGSSLTTKPEYVAHNPQNNSFVSVPSLQSQLSPRFANTDFGANIRYNMPSQQHMAAPQNPLGNACGLSHDVKENFTTPIPCTKQSGNVTSTHGANIDPTDVSSMFPVGTMETVGSDGDSTQAIIYNRQIYANRNSKLRGQGDWIRGDIVPCCASGEHQAWVPKSTNPNNDLNQGSLAVIGGVDNSNLKNMAALMNNSTGESTIAGVQWSSQDLISAGAGLNDINVTGFV